MSNAVIQFLQQRRSVVAKKMLPEPPDAVDLDAILACGLRVPDHANVQPWRIVVLQGDARTRFGTDIILPAARERAKLRGETLDPAMEELEAARMTRAGVVIAVLCTPVVPHKIPLWEQQLSAGAVCTQLLNAAQSLDYAAQWVSEWPAYDPAIIEALSGNAATDQIAGFIMIGTKSEPPAERKRPVFQNIVSYW